MTMTMRPGRGSDRQLAGVRFIELALEEPTHAMDLFAEIFRKQTCGIDRWVSLEASCPANCGT